MKILPIANCVKTNPIQSQSNPIQSQYKPNTNPNKPNFYQKSGKTCAFDAKNLEKLAHLVRIFPQFPTNQLSFFVCDQPNLTLLKVFKIPHIHNLERKNIESQTTALTASTILSTLGILATSSGSLIGGGTSAAARFIGAASR